MSKIMQSLTPLMAQLIPQGVNREALRSQPLDREKAKNRIVLTANVRGKLK
ncbi:hypothetical protein [Colwellia sp. TT2012]|uniref:hypothetical protein n=1 Tax=Colwellia sp. TT2012 TaxID=1720342 RepID=UPI000A6202B7|nr:hypothetical protein [Colwellia sp. TT2012]